MILAAMILTATGVVESEGSESHAPPQHIGFYGTSLERPLTERISLGNKAVLDWQHQINLQYGQDIRPRSARADHPLIPVVHRVLNGLPDEIKAVAARYLTALYLLEDDFGSGSTEAVHDNLGRWRYAYIALNLSVLNRRGNAWGTWKETSTFLPVRGHDVRMTLERPSQDTVESSIRFIVLHELGHVLGLGLKAHGFWDAVSLPSATRNSPFVRSSWRITGDGKMESRWKQRFERLSALSFYNFEKSQLRMDHAENVYRDLASTNFSSLYGATNLFDDFAETFAIYVHTRLMKRPYRVEVLNGGSVRFTYHSCITDDRCPRKVAVLERLLGLSAGSVPK